MIATAISGRRQNTTTDSRHSKDRSSIYRKLLIAAVVASSALYSSNSLQAESSNMWSKCPGGDNAEVFDMEAEKNGLYVLSSHGLFLYTENSDVWKKIYPKDHFPPSDLYTALDIRENVIAIGTLESGIILSTDGGNTWSESNSGLENTTKTILDIRLRPDHRDGEQEFAIASVEGDGLYSSDDGINWQPLNNGIIQNLGRYVRDIEYTPANGWIIGTEGNGLYYSKQVGAPEWTLLESSFSSGEQIFSTVVLNSTIIGGCLNGVRISTNSGGTWERHSAGVLHSSRQFYALTEYKGIVYAGSVGALSNTGYVYRSTDTGRTWSVTNNAFGMENITSLAVYNGYLYASTLSGVARMRIDDIPSSVDDGTSTDKIQLYPNPASAGILTVRLESPASNRLKVHITDIFGKQIESATTVAADGSSVLVEWDRTKTPMGVYFCTVQDEDRMRTVPFSLQ